MIIPLVGGLHAIIDIADYYKVIGYTWCAVLGKRESSTYAGVYRNGRMIYMHRLIRQPPDDMQVDHIDRDGLNNRWSNLRIATQSENAINKEYPMGVSGFIGVYPSGRWWIAKVSKKGKQYHLGTFDTEEEAARARDEAALRIQGAFARLNFPR